MDTKQSVEATAMTEGGWVRKSVFPKVGTCCCLLPLEPGVKLIASAELVICSGLFIFTLIEVTKGAVPGTTPPAGDILYLHYTSLVDVIFAVYLLIGVYFRKPHYAKIWCVAQSVHFMVSLLVTAYRVVFSHTSKTGFPTEIIEFILTTGLDAYFMLVVYSYYQDSKKYTNRNMRPQEIIA